ncbi:hypothetical protein [Variovorax paradoxus]|uniref:hypothetical protein n=1 Tax=Variovorax paradoxus TaxID=34073 RepID=UPI002785D8F1|nr:hypothetical protein [Variovorax paradoxus]MDP9932883.1 hypothetical protein [Variovorax paradoxus]
MTGTSIVHENVPAPFTNVAIGVSRKANAESSISRVLPFPSRVFAGYRDVSHAKCDGKKKPAEAGKKDCADSLQEGRLERRRPFMPWGRDSEREQMRIPW